MVTHNWTTEETACLLNWLDYCRNTKKYYRKTVEERLQAQTKTVLSISTIERRLQYIWERQYRGQGNFDHSKLRAAGISYYAIEKFPAELRRAINSERSTMGLPRLKPNQAHQARVRVDHPVEETTGTHDASDSQSVIMFNQKKLHASDALSQGQNHLEKQPRPYSGRESLECSAEATRSPEQANGDDSQRHDQMIRGPSFRGHDHMSDNDHIAVASSARPRFQLTHTPGTETYNPRPTPSTITAVSLPDESEPVSMENINRNKQAIMLSNHPRRGQLCSESMSQDDMILWLLKGIESGAVFNMQDCQRLKSIQYTIQEPGAVFRKLLEDLLGLETERNQYRKFIESVVGNYSILERPYNLKCPSHRYIDAQWELLREGIKGTIGNQCRGPLPHLPILHGLAIRVDLFTSGYLDQEPFKEWASPHLKGHHANSCTVQTFMTALFVRRVFDCTSTTQIQDHGEKINKIYKIIQESEGIAAVQRLDLIATKMLYEDKDIQCQAIPREVDSIITLISRVSLMTQPPIQIGDLNEISNWVEDAITLKQQLIVSPKEYKILFFSLDEYFDRTSMRAEDEYGHRLSDSECVSAKVKLCLFPAIALCATGTLTQDMDLSAALASQKSFFTKKRRDMIEIISKAVVLVEKDDVFMSGSDLAGDAMQY